MEELPDIDVKALGKWLADAVPHCQAPFLASKFPGGQSNPTYLVRCANKELVLRRKPFGDLLPSAHAIDREYRVISALHARGFPVPQPVALCDDPSVIGSMFYLMQRLDGRIFWNGALPECAPEQRRAIYEGMVDTLAALHSIDPTEAGLADYGKPGNYFDRQVGRWIKQYRAAQTDDIEPIEKLIDWLPRTVPPQTRSSLVHGDYRIDNIVFAPDADIVAGVLDWELSTLGDPLADFAYFAMAWVTPAEGKSGIGGLDLESLGIPTLDAIAARYCAATKRDALPDLHWYFAFNLFRLAGILQGVRKRALNGNASSSKATEVAEKIAPYAARAWRFAQMAGAQ